MSGPPRSGPCSPWCTADEVSGLPTVSAAITAAAAKTPSLDTAALCAEAATAASEVLYRLSARIYTGECGPKTIRPVSRPADADSRGWGLSPLGWFSSYGLTGGYGAGSVGVAVHYGQLEPPTILLPYPVLAITQVKIDGTVIPAGEYELRDYRELVRIRPTASSQPTARYGWPTSQIQDLPDTEPGTFSVSFTFGAPPPLMGQLAARKLAEYLVLPSLGDSTRYPRRVTSITRQGVSATVADVLDILKTESLGIYEVDAFVYSVNPKKLRRPPAVWSPDLARPRRQASP